MPQPMLQDVELHLVTNGQLLDNFFDDMQNHRKLLVTLRIDVVGINYERILRDGSWERLEQNIRRYA